MPFTKYGVANEAQGQLLAGIGASSPTIILQTGQGGLFPPSLECPFFIKVEQYDTALNNYRVLKREIMICTNRSGDTLTVTRSAGYCPADYAATTQTNTAFSFSGGDTVSQILVGEQIEEIQVAVDGKVDIVGGLRSTFWTNKTVNINPATGNERIVDNTLVTTIPDTYEISATHPTTGETQRATMANVKNLLSTAGKYMRSVTLAEDIPAASTQNYTAQAFTTLQPFGLEYGGSMSTPEGAFDTNGGTSASAGNPGWVPRTCTISNIIFPVKITNFSFSWTNQYGISANQVKIYGTRVDGTVDTLYTHSSAIGAGAYNINATITSTYYYTSFTIQQLDLGNGNTSLNSVVTTGTYDVPAINAMSIVDKILYRNSLGSAAGANQVRAGIRINVPYACKIRNVKTWQTTSSSSAALLILDASGNTLQTTTLTTGQQTADLNYSLAANTEYRIVVNDTANWTSWSTYNYTAIANFLATFPYILGSVYGAGAGTLDNANGYIFTELELDFEWKAYRARANRAIEQEFAAFSGLLLGPQTAGATVTLDNNNNTLVSWAAFSKIGLIYISQMAGYIHTTKGLIETVVGTAVSLTEIIQSWFRPKRVQLISDSYAGALNSLPKYFTGWSFDYTLTNNSTNTTYLQWSHNKLDWTDVDSWSAASSTSGKWELPRGYFRIYNPVSTTVSYTIL